MSLKTVAAASILAAANLVAGHGAIIAAVGPAGGTGMALGINPETPRDGTRARPFQQDSTRFKGPNADTFGQTTGGGENDLEAGTKAIMAMTGDQLPQVTPGSTLELTVHQVNADGGGPYDCMINSDATGAQWTNINVPVTVPGQNSRNRAGAMTDFPIKAEIPADQACTGTVAGQANVCLVRCQNAARAGPFGGIVPVQMAQAGNTPAAARRNLARAIAETEQQYKRMMKRAVEAVDAEEEEEE
ncbi:cas1 appressorium specific protein [Colletotrichum incanum]|uniref:Cas1 appressorium specific protein n=1 Tax=Colletotrichum incanum TaxID=1573173 RepID=A0A162NM29_COLIC|nr:cas1 appressorium specific protein [Colletotrichum incanum]OHW95846.1 mas3 protein [Colletotrichum incanum]